MTVIAEFRFKGRVLENQSLRLGNRGIWPSKRDKSLALFINLCIDSSVLIRFTTNDNDCITDFTVIFYRTNSEDRRVFWKGFNPTYRGAG